MLKSWASLLVTARTKEIVNRFFYQSAVGLFTLTILIFCLAKEDNIKILTHQQSKMAVVFSANGKFGMKPEFFGYLFSHMNVCFI